MTILTLEFFQNALAIGILSSITCGIIGAYIVTKRISFITGSIAHASFGGIGISYFLGIYPLLGALGFGIMSAITIGTIRHKFNQQEDTLIGAVWALGMAIGIIFLHLSTGYASDLFGYLFGNILLTTHQDLALITGLNIIVLAIVTIAFRPLQAIIFDEEYATILNLPVFPLYLLLLTLVAITTIVLIKVVGVILVIALLTLPAAAAKNRTKNLKSLMALSIAYGLTANVTGILIAHWINFPAGPVIVIIATLIYATTLIKKMPHPT